jgi:hypothetical protein
MMKILQMFTKYVVVFILVTAICGLVYVSVQQTIRQEAYDPQIQIAEDSAVALEKIETPSFGPDKIDLANSLATFIGIYDKDGNPIESNASLDGELPKPPKGIFDAAKQTGQNRVTWEPKPGLRQALVVVPVKNGSEQFVAVGRSLREVERRENQIFQMTLVVWLIMLAVSLIGVVISDKKQNVEDSATTPEV